MATTQLQPTALTGRRRTFTAKYPVGTTPNERTLYVMAEARTMTVEPEVRLLCITAEARTMTVEPEVRLLCITAEARTMKVE